MTNRWTPLSQEAVLRIQLGNLDRVRELLERRKESAMLYPSTASADSAYAPASNRPSVTERITNDMSAKV